MTKIHSLYELREQVLNTLVLDVEDYDVDAIALELRRRHGDAVDLDDVNADEYWAIVTAHDASTATQITISYRDDLCTPWQVIERETITDAHPRFAEVTLSALDFGGVAGEVYQVEYRDDEDRTIASCDIIAD